jgi:hypothetical protein
MKKQAFRFTSIVLILVFTCVTAISQEANINGNYHVTGGSENGPNYNGELQVIKRGDVYQFRWNVGDEYEGVGVVNGKTVAVAWTSGSNGSGCGVVSYSILKDGALDGIWGMWGTSDAGYERATHVRGTGLAGSYKVDGQNPDESPYETTLTVTAAGRGYQFQWGNEWSGWGIKQGNTVSVGFGGERCSWVAYEIKPNGALDGIWGSYGSQNVGTERAVKSK